MDIPCTQSRQIPSHRLARAGVRIAVAGASLLTLMVLAPRLYDGNNALQSYNHEVTDLHRLQGRLLASMRRREQDMVDEASRNMPGKDRDTFLRKALFVAESELENRELNLKAAQQALRNWDTPWNRIVGNKCLELIRMQVDEHALLVDLARRRIERLRLIAWRKTAS